MKRIFFGMLVLTLILIAGCGQKEQAKTEPGVVQPVTTIIETEEAPAEQAVETAPAQMTDVAEEDKYYCTPNDRNTQGCIRIEMPVCADSGETYVNSCLACMDPSVAYITKGAC